MKPLPIVLIFSGYILVYAAVAAGGKFATEPWAGLFYDAYTEEQSSTVQTPLQAARAVKFGGNQVAPPSPIIRNRRGQITGINPPTVGQAKNFG